MTRDNRGSTLVTVIVAIAFVTILTSIILTTTAMNMSMKGIDRKVKDDFYYAEKGLNDVYTGIGQETAEIAGKQYDAAFRKIGKTFVTADEADAEFREMFLKKCYDKYNMSAGNLKNLLDSYVIDRGLPTDTKPSVAVAGTDLVYPVKYLLNDGTTTTDDDNVPDTAVGVVIPNVSVAATDKYDYQSVITADIVIDCPTVDFLGLNAEVTDYALVGCKGVYFTGTSPSDVIELSGNLYGGVHPTPLPTPAPSGTSPDSDKLFPVTGDKTTLYGGINVLDCTVKMKSNYIVSKGDINVAGNGSVLNISTDANAGVPGVWFDTMRTVKGSSSTKINVKANMFALNDLELNANSSEVKFYGNCDYYGYNDKTLPTDASLTSGDSLGFKTDNGRADDDSSAIIINGNKCKLDMSEVHTLAIMGKAFIDFSSKGSVDSGDPKIAASAESLALQTNQQLYTVPIDFLECPNPADSYNLGSELKFKLNKTREEMEKWFGYKYVKRVDTTTTNKDDVVPADEILTVYKVKIGEEYVYWAYLNFNDRQWKWDADHNKYDQVPIPPSPSPTPVLGTGGSVSSKTAFFDEIMRSVGPAPASELQPSAYRLKGKVLASAKNPNNFDLKGCLINNSDPLETKIIYGRNAIVHYDTTSGSEKYEVKRNTSGMETFANYPQNLFKRYQILCVSLDGKDDYKITESPVTTPWEDSKISSDWKIDAVKTPMSSFVLVDSIDNSNSTYDPAHPGDTTARYLDGDTAGAYGACIISNKGFDIPASSVFKGVAFVDGDITVGAGATVDGLLMATGTITVNGGGSSGTTIKANKGLVQSRVDRELSLVEKGSDYKNNFLITYLAKADATTATTKRLYNTTPGSRREEDRIKADYNSFMHFENWRKGN